MGEGGGLPSPDQGASALAPHLPSIALEWLAETPEAVQKQVEGTLVFVDVSGFTALTDRLAARGKAGAEEIAGVIGTVFGELLGIASSHGADLLKWGGDAVLLLFREPGSAARACRAALLMSRSMRRIGRIRTSAGRISLSVSIGAHTDMIDLYLLGDRHRELIVTGPAATVTAGMEKIAEAGELVVSPETAHRLDPGDLGPPKLGGFLVLRAPEAATATSPLRRSPAGLDIASLLPEVRRTRLLAGGDEAEHRQATVAFVEFSGVDALSDQGGAALVAASLDPVIAAAEDAAHRYGVNFHETDIGADGGKIVLVGGVPLVRGDDAERVLRAVQEVVSTHPPSSPIGLRAGVNAGRVFVFSHDFERAGRRIFSITGDTMNVAARVMGKAQRGQVIATEAALARSRTTFDTDALAPFMVKGKPEPLVAAVVNQPRQAVADDAADEQRFVGRDGELSQLLQHADAAAGGAGGLVEIIGDAGIGKSRLVSEAMRRWDLDTLRVACEEYGSATPYQPFRRIFRRLLGLADDAPPHVAAAALERAVADLAPDLAPFLPLLALVVDAPVPSTREVDELDARFRRPRLEHSVVELLRAQLRGPSALVLEDAHTADEASVSLLRRMCVEVAHLPLLVVLTSGRDTGSPLGEGIGPHVVVELEALSEDAAAQIAALGGGTLAPRQVAVLVERAGGNPLFLRELLRTAGRTGEVEDLPESIEPLLVAEIDLLSPADRQVLRAAAVLGSQFDATLLHELVDGGGDVEGALSSRLGAFVTPTPSGWRFAHALMRDAAYEGLAFKRRKELHARAATAIERRTAVPEDDAELLSLHWLHGECYEAAWHYARLAGDRARAVWANAEAVTLYERALHAASHLELAREDILRVAEALGDAHELNASYARARGAYARARQLASDDVQRARLSRKVGVLLERQGHYVPALGCYTRGRHHLRGDDPAVATERCELNLASAGIRSRQGRYRECLRFAVDAAREASAAAHPSGLAHALYLQHMMSVYLEEPDDELGHRSLAIFEELGDIVGQGNALNNLGISAYYRGRWQAALDCYERSRAARVRSGDVVGAATEENNIAEILSDQSALDAARPLFESARAAWTASGYRVGAALATSNLGRLLAREGDVAEARHLLERALADFEAIQSPVFVAETRLRLAECHLLGGDFPGAVAASLDLLHDVRDRAGLDQTEMSALRVLGTAAALAELTEEGREPSADAIGSLDQAIERSAALNVPYELALGLATRAALGRISEDRHGRVTRAGTAEDQERADALFCGLGVHRAVITWSAAVTGAAIVARSRTEPAGS